MAGIVLLDVGFSLCDMCIGVLRDVNCSVCGVIDDEVNGYCPPLFLTIYRWMLDDPSLKWYMSEFL
jgi:hypothetical protein